MGTEAIIALVWVHFFGDFILQSDWMAKNKSSNIGALWIHVIVYSLPLLFFGWQFAFANGIFHWITDFFSSRMTSSLWRKKETHWFFVVIGFDQAIHLTTLFLTYQIYVSA